LILWAKKRRIQIAKKREVLEALAVKIRRLIGEPVLQQLAA